uniref:Uncharacterized protein n=1 Tax=viral metagenome TaxID=1070528 RepID=A0A6C0C7N9_9ZZZZ
MSQKKIFVNGPLNVVRLSGKVGNLEKSIYVFFDIHLHPASQTKCSDIRSEDVAKFVVDSFDLSNEKNPKLIYDFFFERGPLRPYLLNPKYKGKYLYQMSELFIKSFDIDTEKKIVHKSSIVPNVRFHYVDIRDYAIDMFGIQNALNSHQLYAHYNLENFKRTHNIVANIGNDMYELENIIYRGNENPKIDKMFFSSYVDIRHELPKEYFDDQTKKMMYKIKNSYENKDVKEKINKIINTELKERFARYLSVTNQCLDKLEKLIDEHTKFSGYQTDDILLQQEDGTYAYGVPFMQKEINTFQIGTDINILIDTMWEISCTIMDLYLLRRFLDKKYVTNALSYTGAYHSDNYILFLVKYFGFSITNYSYLKDDNIKKAHEIIKKAHKPEDLYILFWPPVLLQCSNMTNFPPLFT